MAQDQAAEDQVAAILGRAVAISAAADDFDEWSEVWDVLAPLHDLGEAAFHGAVLLFAGDADDQQVACEALGMLCNPDVAGFGPRVADAVSRLAEWRRDDCIAWSAANALGWARDRRGAPLLEELSRHEDADVRWAAASALPSCAVDRNDESLVVDALIRLTADEAEAVRDWATFGLGTQLAMDTTAVRDALAARLDDPHDDTRFEALVGLAQRHDPRALERTRICLRDESVFRLAVVAAEWLAAPGLCDDLIELRSWWDLDPALLDSAIARCDPAAQSEALQWMTAFAQGLAVAPVDAAFACARGQDQEVELTVGDLRWSVEFVRHRFGTVEDAVAAVLSHLRS